MKKSSLIFLAFLALIFLLGFLVLWHNHGARDSRAMEVAVEDGLRRFYGGLVREQSAKGTNAISFSAEVVSQAVRDEFHQPRVFPSLVTATNMAVTTVTVPKGTTNLLCVVQLWKGSWFGLDGTGASRKVSESEYSNWPHRVLSAE